MSPRSRFVLWRRGGLVASAADYLRFAQMLLNEGEYGNVRLLAPHTVRLMTSNALPPDVGYADIERGMSDMGPTRRRVRGLTVRIAEEHNPLPGSIGNFYWTGAWGTTFFPFGPEFCQEPGGAARAGTLQSCPWQPSSIL